MLRSHFVTALLLVLSVVPESSGQASGDSQSQAELERILTALDAALFDSFNRCDVPKFRTFFAEDVEFYHDQSGASYGIEKVISDLEKNICGSDVRREVVQGSLEAHRMKNFGALQTGRHRFLHPKSGEPAGEARFIHLWRNRDGAWKIIRVISFDHRAAQ